MSFPFRLCAIMSLSAAFLPDASYSEEIRIRIVAEVAAVDDRLGLLQGAIRVGDVIRGAYTYESTAADQNTSPTVGDFWYSSAPFGILIEAGGLIFQTDADNVEFLIEIVNNHGTPSSDNYLLRSYNNRPLSSGVFVSHISWQLDDPTSTANGNADLPVSPPVLSDWRSLFGLTLEGGAGRDAEFYVRAHVTETYLCDSAEACPVVGQSVIAGDFGRSGLWFNRNGTWVEEQPGDALDMLHWRGGLVVAFGEGTGLWCYRLFGGWSQLKSWKSEQMAIWQDRLVVDFGVGRGLFAYDGTEWTLLTDMDAVFIETVDKDLFATFRRTPGLWVYREGVWRELSSRRPRRIEKVQ